MQTGGGGVTSVEEIAPVTRVYGVTGHNCGGRCISVAEVQGGRITRILTDESSYSSDGQYLDPNERNIPNTRSCSKCRAYRYRIYHSGRLLYPLKQTKKRGDLSGFQRISWTQAIKEIASKHAAVYKKYGVDGIYAIYAAGASAGSYNNAGVLNSYAHPLMGGVTTSTWASYSTHQWWFAQNGLTGADARRGNHSNNLALYANNVVMWGDNGLATSNPSAYSTLSAVKDMKERISNRDEWNGQVVYVGPEFTDTGIVCADKWFRSQPYTDAALVAGMIYHMLDNTFDLNTGALRTDQTPWLDVDYLDTMVYGFFDSPAYNLTEATGVIAASKVSPNDKTDRNIDAVGKGMSYCSWILGNKTGKAYSDTTVGNNYTAARFNEIITAQDSKYADITRWAPCSLEIGNKDGDVPVYADGTKEKSSKYKTKQDFRTPKTPEWASKITGISEDNIKYLAELFCKHGPIFVRWSGGFQKQAEGVTNFYATQALMVVTKNVGNKGSIFTWGPFSGATTKGGASVLKASFAPVNTGNTENDNFRLPVRPIASCTAWHAIIKATFADKFNAEYKAKHIPNYGDLTKGNAYWGDGGVKAMLVKWKRYTASDVLPKDKKIGDIKTTIVDGKEFYEWETKEDGTPFYAGIRLMYNGGGNIFMNQHENTNDSREMLEALPLGTIDLKTFNIDGEAEADNFCLVSVDNFLSPTPRFSDYVLPGTTYWEQPAVFTPDNSSEFYMRKAVEPGGQQKQLFDIARLLVNEFRKIGGVEELLPRDDKDLLYYGADAEEYLNGSLTVEEICKVGFNANKANTPFKNKTWEEYLERPVVIKKADQETALKPYREEIMKSWEEFRKTDALKTTAFIKVAEGGNNATAPHWSDNNTRHVITYEVKGFCNAPGSGGAYGAEYVSTNFPKASLRMQVINPVMVWNYKHRFEKFHGFLDADQRGQTKKDLDGGEIVYNLPIYYAWEDYFMEAYGNATDGLADVATKYPFKLTTTHNRFRAHSSMVENPLLRELSHNTMGLDEHNEAEYKRNRKGNDYTYYAAAPTKIFPVNNKPTDECEMPELESAEVLKGSRNTSITPEKLVANKDIATFTPLLMNPVDAEKVEGGCSNGDLIEVRNPIGIVYCVAKFTERCAPGFVSLHQGAWYDPRLINDEVVDVGGCCNTLMASQPSRIDNGNAEQSALVKIKLIKKAEEAGA